MILNIINIMASYLETMPVFMIIKLINIMVSYLFPSFHHTLVCFFTTIIQTNKCGILHNIYYGSRHFMFQKRWHCLID